MSIDRVTSNVDLYSHLRVDLYLRTKPTARLPPPSSETGSASSRHSRQNATLRLDVDDRARSPRWEESDTGKVVTFEQTTEVVEQQTDFGDGGTAQEAPLTLEVANAQRNPLLAQAAHLYERTGHPVDGPRAGNVGTRLNAVA
jgi:hypothetical protein